jgi:hypothetical protein
MIRLSTYMKTYRYDGNLANDEISERIIRNWGTDEFFLTVLVTLST